MPKGKRWQMVEFNLLSQFLLVYWGIPSYACGPSKQNRGIWLANEIKSLFCIHEILAKLSNLKKCWQLLRKISTVLSEIIKISFLTNFETYNFVFSWISCFQNCRKIYFWHFWRTQSCFLKCLHLGHSPQKSFWICACS